MRDVFSCKPYGVSIHGSGAIVAPARTNRIHFREVAAESILAGCSFGGNVHITGSHFGIKRGITGAGVMIVTKHGETQSRHVRWNLRPTAG